MARREVIEITCDRCGRTETQEPTQAGKDFKVELTIEFHAEKHQYDDLCMRCRKACENYFKSITKQVENESGENPAGTPIEKKGMFGLGKG